MGRFEQQHIDHALAFSFVGTQEKVREGLENFIDKTGADGVMITGMIYDHGARFALLN